MHLLRRKGWLSRAAMIAGLLALASAFTAPVSAEDPQAPAPSAETPLLIPVEPTTPDNPPVDSAATLETNPCFTGRGSIKEVLDACAAFIISGSADKDRIVAAHANRAIGLSATRDFDGAVAEMNEAIRLDPSEANLYLMRGAAYRATKDFDKAIADVDEAIRLDASRGDFYMLRGMIFGDQGDLDRAITELNQKVKLDPESAPGYAKRAELFRQKKDYDSAVADYSEVVKRQPDNAKGFVDRGWIYVLKNDLDHAMEDFTAALKIHENDASALVGVGLVKSRKGKPTDGSREISHALTLEPGIVDEIKKLGVE